MAGGNESWPDLGSQNERLVVPLADQDERLVDPQTAQQAGLPVAPRPLIPRSRTAAGDEPEDQPAGYGRPGSAGGAGDPGDSGQRGWSGLRRLRRGRPAAAAAAVTALAAAALAAGSGLAANDVWAAGGKQVAHWNGHAWKRASVASLLPPNTMFQHAALAGVYEQSPTSVWAVGSGDRQDEGGPVVVLHFDGHSWSKAAQGGFGNPAQIVPDGSGGLWIPVPGIDGEPGQIVHFTGGRLHEAPLPITGQRLIVQAIAHVPGTTRSFGAGQTHQKNSLGIGLHAVLLQVN